MKKTPGNRRMNVRTRTSQTLVLYREPNMTTQQLETRLFSIEDLEDIAQVVKTLMRMSIQTQFPLI